MFINFKGKKTYIGTGGKKLDKNKTTILESHPAESQHKSLPNTIACFEKLPIFHFNSKLLQIPPATCGVGWPRGVIN